MSVPQRIRTFNSRTTERLDNTSYSVVPEFQIYLKQEDAKNKAIYIAKHPFASSWSWKLILDFENKGKGVSINDKLYYPESYKPQQTTVSKDAKSLLLHKLGLLRAKLELLKLEENRLQDFLNNFTNETIGYIPGVNAFTRIGLDLWSNRTNNPRATEYGINAGLGLIGDATTFYLGGTKPLLLATTYAGAKIGKEVGKENPLLGELTGAVVGNGVYNIGKDLYTLGNRYMLFRNMLRLFLRSVKNEPITTLAVEHVSSNPRTIGSLMTPYSNFDVGLHLSLPGSNTTRNILFNSEVPTTIRQGLIYYTKNTAPVNFGKDLGLWNSKTNPNLFKLRPWNYNVNLDKPTALDAMRLADSNPIGSYTNEFEGQGETSLLVTNPNYVLLSLNEITPSIMSERHLYPNTYLTKDGMYVSTNQITLLPEVSELLANFKYNGTNYSGILPGFGLYHITPNTNGTFNISRLKLTRGDEKQNLMKQIGSNISKEDLVNFFTKLRKSYLESASPELKQAFYDYNIALSNNQINFKNPSRHDLDRLIIHTSPEMRLLLEEMTNNEIQDVYNSEEYLDRIRNILKLEFPSASNQQIEHTVNTYILQINNHLHTPFVFKGNPTIKGFSATKYISNNRGWNNEFGVNLTTATNGGFTESTLSHELGHTLYNDTFMGTLNNYLFKKYGYPNKHVVRPLSKEGFNYITNPDEFRLRMNLGFRLMLKENLSVPEVLSDPRFIDTEIPITFDKNYIETLLPLMAQNNDTSQSREPNIT